MKYLKLFEDYSTDLADKSEKPEIKPISTQLSTSVKEGVAELFESNPELATIGTAKQYSQYLDTIFPDSQVKDIVYHSTNAEFKEFDPSKAGTRKEGAGAGGSDLGAWGKGLYFTPNAKYTKVYGKNRHAVIVNITNPKTIINNEADNSMYTGKSIQELWGKDKDGVIQKVTDWLEFLYDGNPHGKLEEFQEVGLGFKPEIIDVVVDKSNQIYALGSKQDIEGFKNFVTQPPNN